MRFLNNQLLVTFSDPLAPYLVCKLLETSVEGVGGGGWWGGGGRVRKM